MTKEEMRERLLGAYKEEIALCSAFGMTMEQIADYLYDDYQISYIERDILKGDLK